MRFFNFFIFLIFTKLLITSSFGQQKNTKEELIQNDSIFKEVPQLEQPNIILQDKTFNPKIKTVLCHKKEEPLSLAIINLKVYHQNLD